MSDDEDNIIEFGGNVKVETEIGNISVEDVLKGVQAENLKSIIVIGEEQDGSMYLATSSNNITEVYWKLSKVQKELLDFE